MAVGLVRVCRLTGAVYPCQGIGGRVSSLAEDRLAGCRQLVVRFCRLLGTAAEGITDPEAMVSGLPRLLPHQPSASTSIQHSPECMQ